MAQRYEGHGVCLAHRPPGSTPSLEPVLRGLREMGDSEELSSELLVLNDIMRFMCFKRS